MVSVPTLGQFQALFFKSHGASSNFLVFPSPNSKILIRKSSLIVHATPDSDEEPSVDWDKAWKSFKGGARPPPRCSAAFHIHYSPIMLYSPKMNHNSSIFAVQRVVAAHDGFKVPL